MAPAGKTLRSLPSIDRLVTDLGGCGVPRPIVVQLARKTVDHLRRDGEIPAYAEILKQVRSEIARTEQCRLQPVINATGIALHTNLGRAPLSAEGLEMMVRVAGGYSNLELDLATGNRGSRGEYVELCLRVLCGCAGAAVVNNCAAALMLILNQAVRDGKPEVIISRGELVQIGGGFRIPEILESSGAVMREVGTTNRTTVDDYRAAITDRTGLILVVHRSNFSMQGFVESPRLSELVSVAQAGDVPLVYDQGSGTTTDIGNYEGVEGEPSVSAILSLGVDLVCCSGDKLFGGPQAGILCGLGSLVLALKKNPLYRALRCDKLSLGVLQATLEAYLSADDGGESLAVPVHRILQTGRDELRQRGERIREGHMGEGWILELVETVTEVGGGTLPQSRVPSISLKLRNQAFGPQRLARWFRERQTPVLGYVREDAFHLDLRTVDPQQDDFLRQCLCELLEIEFGGRER